MSELKPCPFCGSKESDKDNPISVWWTANGDDDDYGSTGEWSVECSRCGCNTGWFNRPTREEAIEAWNRRATDGN